MAKPEFTWRVTSQASIKHKFAVRSVQFGDGYEQRQPKFLRPKMQSWEVKLVGFKPMIEEVKAFLDARRGVESFYWTPPGRLRLLVVAPDEYTETPEGGKVYSLTCTFKEVMA